MNRRQAIMASIGSIFGGKSAVQEAIHGKGLKYALGTAGNYPGVEEGPTTVAQDVDPNRLNTRIKDLEKRSMGFLSGWEEREIENDRRIVMYHKYTQEIDNFKSLSVSGKFLIIQEKNERRRRDNFKRHAKMKMEELILSRDSMGLFRAVGEKLK